MIRNLSLLLLLSAAPIQATIITVTGVDWARGGMATFLADGVEESGFAGVINATYDGTPSIFFCVDLFTNISYGDYSSSPIFPRLSRNEDRAAWLYIYALPTITTAVQGEALQLAIWDIVHDNGDGFTHGRVQQSINSDVQVIQAATSYLALSLNQSSMGAAIYLNAVLSLGDPAQAFIGPLQITTQTAVPEGSSIAMTALGGGVLIALGCYRRRTLDSPAAVVPDSSLPPSVG